jgi:hypothetical protein
VLSWQASGTPKFDSLKNAGEEVVLRDMSGTIIDEVDYAGASPGQRSAMCRVTPSS